MTKGNQMTTNSTSIPENRLVVRRQQTDFYPEVFVNEYSKCGPANHQLRACGYRRPCWLSVSHFIEDVICGGHSPTKRKFPLAGDRCIRFALVGILLLMGSFVLLAQSSAPATTIVGPNSGNVGKQTSVLSFSKQPKPSKAGLTYLSGAGLPVAFSNGDGTFNVPPSSPSVFPNLFAGVRGSAKLLVGDFNGDGITDFALLDYGWAVINVAISDGKGNFSLKVAQLDGNFLLWYTGAWPSTTVIAADFDGDGRTDIALLTPGWTTIPIAFSQASGNFHVTNCMPRGNFMSWYSSAWASVNVAVGDFDGDGKADIGLFNSNWTTLPIVFSLGDGNFSVSNGFPSSPILTWYSAVSSTTKIFAADFNGDGKTDYALINPNWNTIPVAFSNGDGSFSVYNQIPSAPFLTWYSWVSGTAAVVAADFNGDGKADFAIVNPGWNTIPVALADVNGHFTVFNQIPGGPFLDWYLGASSTATLILADLDGDGKTDLALVNPGWTTIPVAFSRENGHFDITNALLSGDFFSSLSLAYPNGSLLVGAFAGEPVGPAPPPVPAPPQPPPPPSMGMLTVNVEGLNGGEGTVAVSGHGSCVPGPGGKAVSCSYEFPTGTAVTITPNPYSFSFAEQFGNCGNVTIGTIPLICGVEFFSTNVL